MNQVKIIKNKLTKNINLIFKKKKSFPEIPIIKRHSFIARAVPVVLLILIIVIFFIEIFLSYL